MLQTPKTRLWSICTTELVASLPAFVMAVLEAGQDTGPVGGLTNAR